MSDPEDIELTDTLKREAVQAGWELSTFRVPCYFTARSGLDSIAVRVDNGQVDIGISRAWRGLDPLQAITKITTEERDV